MLPPLSPLPPKEIGMEFIWEPPKPTREELLQKLRSMIREMEYRRSGKKGRSDAREKREKRKEKRRKREEKDLKRR